MKIIFIALMMALSLTALAQDQSLQSLKGNMKQTEKLFRQIGANINDASKNQENAALLDQMIQIFQAARTQSPDSVRRGSFADYQALMDQEIQNFTELKAAFLSNDNALALALAQKISVTKKEGHDKYK